MGKRLMCAEIEKDPDGYFKLGLNTPCDPRSPDNRESKEFYNWRDAVKLEASHENLELEDSDLIDVKGYIAFKIRTSIFFEDKIFLDNIKGLPEGYVIVGTSDGYPLMAFWEEDF